MVTLILENCLLQMSFVREWQSLQKHQQFHDVVSRTLELFPNKEILNIVLVLALRAMLAAQIQYIQLWVCL